MSNKLLFFASDYGIGLSALLAEQLVAINKSGADVYAVAGDGEQEEGLTDYLAAADIRIERIDGLDTHTDFRRLVAAIREIVLRENISVIHTQNNWQLALAYAVKCRLRFRKKVSIAYTVHGYRNNVPLKAVIARFVIGAALLVAADKVICMTEFLRSKFRMLSYKIRVIPLGVKENFFEKEFPQPGIDALRLVFPAQFREGKNQDLIMRAFKRYVVLTGDTSSTLTLPGAGARLETMKALARELGIKKQVRFPGRIPKEQVRKLYLESNIAIVASNSETFGQSIVEPFVLGRCVVSTSVGIAPEIIRPGVNGYLFQSELELTDILIKLSADKQAIRDMGAKNFNGRDRFNWPTIIRQYKDYLGI